MQEIGYPIQVCWLSAGVYVGKLSLYLVFFKAYRRCRVVKPIKAIRKFREHSYLYISTDHHKRAYQS
jgi:hypothetical protein